MTLWFADNFSRTASLGRLSLLTFPVVLLDAVRRNKQAFDVVIAHEACAAALAFARKMDKGLPPLVAMCHNVESKVWIRMKEAHHRGLADIRFSTRLKTPLLRTSQTDFAVRNADRVVCLSSEDREYITDGLLVPRERVLMTANGVDPLDKVVDRSNADTGVLFIGGWLDVKGKAVLKRILTSWKRRSHTVTLAGTGVDEQTIRAELGHHESLIVVPRFSQDELLHLLATHSALIVPSISEGSPLSLLEAMSSGLPAVASRTGGIPDIIQNDTNGLMFDAFEPTQAVGLLERLLNDSERARAMSIKALERSAQFTWERTTDVIEQAATEAVG